MTTYNVNLFNVPQPRDAVSKAALLALPLNLLSLIISHVRAPPPDTKYRLVSEADCAGRLIMLLILHDAVKHVVSSIT